ncbi:MAG: hypothetical protein IKQ94_06450 [Bacteroidales bacterium]|nr:hypothetical protein [Bacteroidales bacterium]
MKTLNLKLKTVLVMGAATAMLFSCAKEELDENAEVKYGPKKHIGVNAQIITGTPDKAYMDVANYKVIWEDGDAITVNDGTLSMTEIDADDPTSAKFEGSAAPNTYLESGKDVYRSIYPASIISSIPANANPMVVTLPAAQTFTATNPTKVEDNYMAAYTSVASGSDVNDMVFRYKNLCSVIKMVFTPQSGASGVDAQISRIRIASSQGLSGNFNVTFSNGEPVLTAVSASPVNVVDKIYTTPLDLSTTLTIYAVVPPITNQSLVMQIWNGDGSRVIEKQVASTTLGRSRVHTATINQPFSDWGRTFSVADNQRVYFAHGNLKYKLAGTDAGAWRFFDQQYGMCTKTEVENTLSQNNARDHSTDPGFINVPQNGDASYLSTIEARANAIHALDQWTDHFNFGNTGYNAGSRFYQPWHTFYGLLQNGGITVYTGYGYGPVNAYSVAQHLAGTNSDWGVYHRTELNNSLTPSGNDWRTHRGDWRTPTQAEWLYLIQGANRIDKIALAFKYGLARIEVTPGTYVNGLMLIPDKWHWFLMPGGHTFQPFIANDANNDFSNNTYTLAEWQSLDELGACFLPAGGTRLDHLMDYGEGGFYQSASAALNVVTNPNGWASANQRGFSMHFYSKRSNSQTAHGYPNGIAGVWGPQEGTYIGAFNKIDGHNVRLVRNTTDQ